MNEHYPILNTPRYVTPLTSNFHAGVLTQDTAGEQVAIWGTPSSESWTAGVKTITGVDVTYNTVTSNVNSIWNVSLQQLSASGAPQKPNGIQLAVWSGSATMSAQTVIRHTFTSSYDISPNTKLAVVFAFQSFSSTTAVNILSYTARSNVEYASSFGVSTSTNSGSTWTSTFGLPHLRFVCADNSYLYFKDMDYGMGTSRATSTDYTSGDTGTGIDSGDERGMLWIPKKTYDITGFSILTRFSSTASTAETLMYKDTNILASKSLSTLDNPDFLVPMYINAPLTSPIRVYPNDNIRITIRPVTSSIRHYRFSFSSSGDLQKFFGDAGYETNLSLTNRVDGGGWNTPTSASYSLIPIQIYGYEVTGSALLSGSNKISGSIELNGQPVVGATVTAMRQSDGNVMTTTSSISGAYIFNLTSSNYHVFVEYESGSQKYNALSSWDIQPI